MFVIIMVHTQHLLHSGLLNLVQPPIYLYTRLLGCVSDIVLSHCFNCDELKTGLVRNIKTLPECTVGLSDNTNLLVIQ